VASLSLQITTSRCADIRVPTLSSSYSTPIQYPVLHIQHYFVSLGKVYSTPEWIYSFPFFLFHNELRPSFVTDAVQVDHPTQTPSLAKLEVWKVFQTTVDGVSTPASDVTVETKPRKEKKQHHTRTLDTTTMTTPDRQQHKIKYERRPLLHPLIE
jgi:hypothetical protein